MYHQTQNENGTYNTRCLDCLMTIAFCLDSREELAKVEAEHLCPEKLLARMFALQQTEDTQRACHRSHTSRTGSTHQISSAAADTKRTASAY